MPRSPIHPTALVLALVAALALAWTPPLAAKSGRSGHGRHGGGDHGGRHGDDDRRWHDDDHGRVRHDGRHFHGAWFEAADGHVEFEARIVSVDPVRRLLILESGRFLAVVPETRFHLDGDLHGFEPIAAAVAAGRFVEVEGFAAPGDDGLLLAGAIKVEHDGRHRHDRS